MKFDIIDRDYNPMMETLPFSVCITVKNESKNIYNLLVSIFAQTLPPDEIVIVDGGSEDNTCDLINAFRDYRINLMRVPCSPAEGRNIAAKAARHEVQVLVDAGCKLDRKLFVNLVGPMSEKNPPDLASGIYKAMTNSPWSRYFIPNWQDDNAIRDSYLPSCRCIAMTRTLHNKVGGFPEGMKQRWGEDTDFMIKAQAKSKRWVLNRNAVVLWDCPKTLEESKALYYRYGMGNGEIGCDRYVKWHESSADPVLRAAYEGYKEGCRLRESVA